MPDLGDIPDSTALAVAILVIFMLSVAGGLITHYSRRKRDRETRGAPPMVATPEPEPEPPSPIYGNPILVLTPTPSVKYQVKQWMPGVKVVMQGEPGWEGFKLKPNDILVIYRKEVPDDPAERTEKHGDEVPEPIMRSERGAADGPTGA